MAHWNKHMEIIAGDDPSVKPRLPKRKAVNAAVNDCLSEFNSGKNVDFWVQVDTILQHLMHLSKSQGAYITRCCYNAQDKLDSLLCISLRTDKQYGVNPDDVIDEVNLPIGTTFPMLPNLLHSRAVEYGGTVVGNIEDLFVYHQCPGIRLRNIYYHGVRNKSTGQLIGLICLINNTRGFSVTLTDRFMPLYNLLGYKWVQEEYVNLAAVNPQNIDLSTYIIKESGDISALLDLNLQVLEYSAMFMDTIIRLCKTSSVPKTLQIICEKCPALAPLIECINNDTHNYRMYSVNTGIVEEYFELKVTKLTDSKHILLLGRNVTRTRQLYASLESAKKEIEHNLQNKDMYLSKVSHELKTPLNAINGFAQIIELHVKNGKPVNMGHIQKIIACCGNLKTLINDVISISHIGTGKIHLSKEEVEVNITITEVASTLQALAREKSITINTNYNGNWYISELDAVKFKSIITNIVSNAIKYNKQYGTVDINVTAETPELVISIRDTGIGIPKGEFKNLYTPFNRCGMDQTDIEGTGMGLTVAKCYTEVMGGTINIESDYGHGTVVVLRFPLLEIRDTGVNVNQNDDERVEDVILYVEDNALNYEFMSAVIEMMNLENGTNYVLKRAPNGKQALELTKNQRYSCIILDLGLPDLHGKEVFKILQSDPRTKDIPVIIYTASMDRNMKTILRSYGQYAEYLYKPSDISHLRKTIIQVLEK